MGQERNDHTVPGRLLGRGSELMGEEGFMVDCSECKNCYIHPVAWGEYWCRIKEAKTGDGWVYELHSLKKKYKK